MTKEEIEKMLVETDEATTAVVTAFISLANAQSMRPIHLGLLSALCDVVLRSTLPEKEVGNIATVAREALCDWCLLNRTNIVRDGDAFVRQELTAQNMKPSVFLLMEALRGGVIAKRQEVIDRAISTPQLVP